jgi:aspartyl-tRNA(Asn)/glutamyl-tRNA(Gln) amidotransferase subunit B
MDWEIIVCFEVHVELKTATKLFCPCPTGPGAAPNSHICPVCTGQPGALPVLNRKAVEHAVAAGLALNCRINPKSRFARKNYFYPDLPKGYQISQYEIPICEGGYLEIEIIQGTRRRIGIKRIHLEEDAGKLMHSTESKGDPPYSLVDYNRSGIPLIEIVGDHRMNPISSSAEARAYLEALRQLLRDIEVSECAIEKGQFRCDVNVSVRRRGDVGFQPRTEIKNMSSIRFICEAIDYEAARQIRILSDGGTLLQETRRFNEEKKITLPMRGKEDAPDYRYFPEPDLLPLHIDRPFIEDIRRRLPECADKRVTRLTGQYSLSREEAFLIAREKETFDYFLLASGKCRGHKRLARLIIRDLFALLNNADKDMRSCPVAPEDLAELSDMVEEGKVTAQMAGEILKEMFKTGEKPGRIVEIKELRPFEGNLNQVISETLAVNTEAVDAVRSGKNETVNFLVGQVMRASSGRADARDVKRIILQMISSKGK